MGPTAGKRFPDGERDELLLADGAMAQEKLPLFPFLQPSRMGGYDHRFGLSGRRRIAQGSKPERISRRHIYASDKYETSTGRLSRLQIYKDFEQYQQTTFTDRGYHRRPTFFGCNEDVPLVIYIPNHYLSYDTSQSTMQAVYKKEDIKGFFENGFYVATQSHPSQKDTEWPACLLVHLSIAKTQGIEAQDTSMHSLFHKLLRSG
ncbi:hypothetical protein H4Q26_003988 [Puccinia striiformis f. sp. tritici PST-130]|nr:hypothetical protein H4Q26_003988 [Puccinia striiformis f. sp. tritici PST-130]